MLNKSTSRGSLAARGLPNADGKYGTYYFCTDNNTYYYSDGENWIPKVLDKTDLSPDTDSQIICGISADGSINPISLDADGNVKVSGVGGGAAVIPRGAFTSRSGTIAAANTSQLVAAANPTRSYLFFQNTSDTDMYINLGSNATTSSIVIPKNGGGIGWDTFVPTNALYVLCLVINKKFAAFEA